MMMSVYNMCTRWPRWEKADARLKSSMTGGTYSKSTYMLFNSIQNIYFRISCLVSQTEFHIHKKKKKETAIIYMSNNPQLNSVFQ